MPIFILGQIQEELNITEAESCVPKRHREQNSATEVTAGQRRLNIQHRLPESAAKTHKNTDQPLG